MDRPCRPVQHLPPAGRPGQGGHGPRPHHRRPVHPRASAPAGTRASTTRSASPAADRRADRPPGDRRRGAPGAGLGRRRRAARGQPSRSVLPAPGRASTCRPRDAAADRRSGSAASAAGASALAARAGRGLGPARRPDEGARRVRERRSAMLREWRRSAAIRPGSTSPASCRPGRPPPMRGLALDTARRFMAARARPISSSGCPPGSDRPASPRSPARSPSPSAPSSADGRPRRPVPERGHHDAGERTDRRARRPSTDRARSRRSPAPTTRRPPPHPAPVTRRSRRSNPIPAARSPGRPARISAAWRRRTHRVASTPTPEPGLDEERRYLRLLVAMVVAIVVGSFAIGHHRAPARVPRRGDLADGGRPPIGCRPDGGLGAGPRRARRPPPDADPDPERQPPPEPGDGELRAAQAVAAALVAAGSRREILEPTPGRGSVTPVCAATGPAASRSSCCRISTSSRRRPSGGPTTRSAPRSPTATSGAVARST